MPVLFCRLGGRHLLSCYFSGSLIYSPILLLICCFPVIFLLFFLWSILLLLLFFGVSGFIHVVGIVGGDALSYGLAFYGAVAFVVIAGFHTASIADFFW